MPSCDKCGRSVNMPFTCNECGGTYCSDHRLPEKHVCSLNRVTLNVRRSTRVLSYLFMPLVLLWMGLRWLFRPKLFVLGVAGIVLVSATAGTGVPVVDRTVDDGLAVGADVADSGASFVGGIVGNVSESLNDSDAPESEPEGSESDGVGDYERDLVERYFIKYLNQERAERGLQNVSHREILSKMGDEHAAKMASEGRIFHTWPDGTSIEDRYRERGLLPECRLQIRGTREYYPGAENAAQTWVERDVLADGGTKYMDSEKDLARGLVTQWMNSKGHREAMLVYSADEAGLGLNITSTGQVYAALELC